MAGTVHILGAGLAGLSAAVRLLEEGADVCVYEAAGHAGGRCRSFHDETLGKTIDNGNHLVLSGNHAAMQYLNLIDARDRLLSEGRASFPFLDLKTGDRWTLKPDKGLVPWSIFSKSGRVPGASLASYLKSVGIAGAGPNDNVGGRIPTDGALWHRFWAPLIVSIMNTRPEEASAVLIWRVLKETFGRGEAACRPLLAPHGLGAAFVAPALAFIEARGGKVLFNARVRRIDFADGRVSGLAFASGDEAVGREDHVISALPASVAAGLIPDLQAPDRFSAIVNGHFALPEGTAINQPFLGLVNGVAEWLFVRDGIVSVTVSAANDLADEPAEHIAASLWADITTAFNLGAPSLTAYRIVKEKRATFEQTPAQVIKRPSFETTWKNLLLAGDWTDTGLPATIEGAIRSGFSSAKMILNV